MTRTDSAACPLTLSLFGPFEAQVNGVPLPRLRSRKGQWLLALLALRAGSPLPAGEGRGGGVERSWVAGTLWPESLDTAALASLRMSLADLRRALGPATHRLTSPTPRTLCLDLAGAEVDVLAFDAAIARGDPASLECAISLYRGPLLEGCTEEWAFQERHSRQQAYLQALEALATEATAQGDPATAERHLRRAIAVDPLRESAQRALMQALATGGNYAAAIQVYRELRLLLHREVHAEPDPETTALFQQLRSEARAKADGGRGRREDGAIRPAPAAPAVAPPSHRPIAPSPRRPLPAGTVTFLFTDIEGSTRLWEQHPEAMRAALARHDALGAALFEQHCGTLVRSRGEGDSLFAVFARASDALAAAAAFQQALAAEPWPPETPLRVRVALHTGEADLRDGDYYGSEVNRCARLRAVGHGGQTLLSQTTAALVRDDLPEGASLRDLGTHRLKDLQRPEPIFQLVHPDLTAEFPPLRSLEAFAHNLPLQSTRFIGREREIEEVKRLLQTARLLTLTGAGGCGKTRLALQVAADRVEEYADGVWLVELAALSDPALVPQTVAAALGVREAGAGETRFDPQSQGRGPEPGESRGIGDRSLLATLLDHLRPRSLLLVLDNCEHLLSACAHLVEELRRDCPNLRVLATSREGLSIAGEQSYRVPSLSVPDPRKLPPVEWLQGFEAVGLFVDRAILSRPGFEVTPANAAAVAQVCHQLDGIPLAIELAAARVKALPVEAIAARLDDRFRLLTGGSRTALPRQQTLRALIDWSYDLLTDPEQALLRRLSVFAGGWTLEAAEAVCAGDGIEGWDVLDLLSRLVEKSLVVYEEQEREARYHLLETVRQYSREQMSGVGETEAVRRRHRDYFLELAQQAEPALSGAEQAVWLKRLDVEYDNLRAALEWCQEAGDVEGGLSLATALLPFWLKRGYFAEGIRWLQGAMSENSSASASSRAKALHTAGFLGRHQSDFTASRSFLEAGLVLAREAGETQIAAYSLFQLGCVVRAEGDYERATALASEALAFAQQTEDKRLLACSLTLLGSVARSQNDYERATALQEECLSIARELEDRWWVALTLGELAELAEYQGNDEQTIAFYQEQLALAHELVEKRQVAESLLGLASVAAGQGQPERAARLMGAIEAFCETTESPRPSVCGDLRNRAEGVRAVLGEPNFAAAWAVGRAMLLEEAIADALEPPDAAIGRPAP